MVQIYCLSDNAAAKLNGRSTVFLITQQLNNQSLSFSSFPVITILVQQATTVLLLYGQIYCLSDNATTELSKFVLFFLSSNHYFCSAGNDCSTIRWCRSTVFLITQQLNYESFFFFFLFSYHKATTLLLLLY